jgi:hypothetical protein
MNCEPSRGISYWLKKQTWAQWKLCGFCVPHTDLSSDLKSWQVIVKTTINSYVPLPAPLFTNGVLAFNSIPSHYLHQSPAVSWIKQLILVSKLPAGWKMVIIRHACEAQMFTKRSRQRWEELVLLWIYRFLSTFPPFIISLIILSSIHFIKI